VSFINPEESSGSGVEKESAIYSEEKEKG